MSVLDSVLETLARLGQQELSLENLAEAVRTAPGTAAIGAVLLVVLIPSVRRAVWTVADTVAATVLLLVLLSVVLGLPFGAVYMSYKGALFLWESLTNPSPDLGFMA